MNYYKEISELIEKKYVKDNVRRLQSNNDTLKTYYEIGKLLVQAQGGETRAKYGNGLIKEWSEKLVQKYGKGILEEVAKLSFKNTEKIEDIIKSR